MEKRTELGVGFSFRSCLIVCFCFFYIFPEFFASFEHEQTSCLATRGRHETVASATLHLHTPNKHQLHTHARALTHTLTHTHTHTHTNTHADHRFFWANNRRARKKMTKIQVVLYLSAWGDRVVRRRWSQKTKDNRGIGNEKNTNTDTGTDALAQTHTHARTLVGRRST